MTSRAARIVAACGCALLLAGCGRMQACGKKKPEPRLVERQGPSDVLPEAASRAGAEVEVLPGRVVEAAGRRRSYVLVRPRARRPGRPLVLVLHGDGGDGAGFHTGFPFERGSGEEAILAYPDGLHTTWDLEGAPDRNKDFAFLAAIVDDLARSEGIDRRRVFGAGYSSGGFLLNFVACYRPGFLRAISSSAGGAPYGLPETFANGYPKCPGQIPTPVIALHGRQDFAVTFDSGTFTAQYWAYVNGCDDAEIETTAYPECAAYRGCRSGKSVVFCDVKRLGHWVWDRAAEASWTFFMTQSRG